MGEDYNYVAADLQKSVSEMTADRDKWRNIAMTFLSCQHDTCACKAYFAEFVPGSQVSS
jgi:hypothetical protein